MAKWLSGRNKLCGMAMLIKREAMNCVKQLDPLFTPGYAEDDALSLRIILAGYRFFYAICFYLPCG